MKNGSKATLAAIPQGKGVSRAEITADGLPVCHGRVKAGFSRHHGIDRCADPNHSDFAENGVRIDSFQSHDKRHQQKFNGPRADCFPAFLKDTGFHVNNRTNAP